MSVGSSGEAYDYPGGELDLFAPAHRWRSYWQSRITTLVHSDVLEVGAGIGTITRDLAPSAARWLALEPDRRLAMQIDVLSAETPTLEVRIGDIGVLAQDEFFDTILYIDVIEHIKRDAEELERAAEHLRDGGHLIVLAPAFPALYSRFDAAVGHHRRYTRRSLAALAPPGMALLRIEHLDVMGLLVSFLNRLGRDQESPRKWQIGLWDRFLIPLTRVLDPLVRRRAGKSLLAVWCRS